MKDKLTLARLKDSFGDVNRGIEFAQEFYPKINESPTKPFLKRNPTSTEAIAYAKALEQFEKSEIEYAKKETEYYKAKEEVDVIIRAYVKDMAGFHRIPEKYRDKVWSKAWEDGHSSGYSEIYNCLSGLVDLFI